MGSSDDTLYAIWTVNASHTVTFNQNCTAANDPMSAQTIVEGLTTALSANTYTNAGHSFSGWSETANGAVKYQNRGNYTMGSANDTLYAIWTVNASHTVTFNQNCTAPNDPMSAQTIVEGLTAALSANTYTNAGYSFSGWSESADGAVKYQDKGNYTMGSIDVTLYAIWTEDPTEP
jgi:uncharacterized repeat protein (TIGR02543 family)